MTRGVDCARTIVTIRHKKRRSVVVLESVHDQVVGAVGYIELVVGHLILSPLAVVFLYIQQALDYPRILSSSANYTKTKLAQVAYKLVGCEQVVKDNNILLKRVLR